MSAISSNAVTRKRLTQYGAPERISVTVVHASINRMDNQGDIPSDEWFGTLWLPEIFIRPKAEDLHGGLKDVETEKTNFYFLCDFIDAGTIIEGFERGVADKNNKDEVFEGFPLDELVDGLATKADWPEIDMVEPRARILFELAPIQLGNLIDVHEFIQREEASFAFVEHFEAANGWDNKDNEINFSLRRKTNDISIVPFHQVLKDKFFEISPKVHIPRSLVRFEISHQSWEMF